MGEKPKLDTNLMEPRYTELAEKVRNYKPAGPAPAGGTWDDPASQTQLTNLGRIFGDKVSAVVTALWGLSNVFTARQAAAIFASYNKDPQGTEAKLLRLAEEAPKEEPIA